MSINYTLIIDVLKNSSYSSLIATFIREAYLRTSFWRYRLRAGFSDNFGVLEVSVQSPNDAPHSTEDEREFLGWDEEAEEVLRKPEIKSLKVNTGFILGLIGILGGVFGIL